MADADWEEEYRQLPLLTRARLRGRALSFMNERGLLGLDVDEVASRIYAYTVGPARGLDLFHRVQEFMRTRGWPSEDVDLAIVLCLAVGYKKLGAGLQLLRRPPGADGLKGLWPMDQPRVAARELVEMLELQDLLQNR